jgi:hypothetical protein
MHICVVHIRNQVQVIAETYLKTMLRGEDKKAISQIRLKHSNTNKM